MESIVEAEETAAVTVGEGTPVLGQAQSIATVNSNLGATSGGDQVAPGQRETTPQSTSDPSSLGAILQAILAGQQEQSLKQEQLARDLMGKQEAATKATETMRLALEGKVGKLGNQLQGHERKLQDQEERINHLQEAHDQQLRELREAQNQQLRELREAQSREGHDLRELVSLTLGKFRQEVVQSGQGSTQMPVPPQVVAQPEQSAISPPSGPSLVVSRQLSVADHGSAQSLPVTSGVLNLPRPNLQYDGSTDVEEFLTRFQLTAKVNAWDEAQKGTVLASLLKGTALFQLLQLPEGERENFSSIKASLEKRFGSQADLLRVQFKSRTQKRTESVMEFGAEMQKMGRRAYATVPLDVLDSVVIDQFIQGLLDDELQKQMRLARCKSWEECLTTAVQIESALAMSSKHRAPVVRQIGDKPEDPVVKVLNRLETAMMGLAKEVKSAILGGRSSQVYGQNSGPKEGAFRAGDRSWNRSGPPQFRRQGGNEWPQRVRFFHGAPEGNQVQDHEGREVPSRPAYAVPQPKNEVTQGRPGEVAAVPEV